jgi:hypothetical protein
MAQLASLPPAVEPPFLTSDILAGDHIGFDAWLLPPKSPSRLERAIRAGSFAAGPVAFVGALVCVLRWIV